VQLGEALVFMDPTAETTSFGNVPLGDQEREVLVFFDGTYAIKTIPPTDNNGIVTTMDIDLTGQGNAVIKRSLNMHGFFAAAYRGYVKYTHPALIEEEIRKKMIEICSSSSLDGYTIENETDFDKDPLLTYGFRAQQWLNPAGKLRIVPILDEAYIDRKLIGKDKRSFPIDLEGLYSKKAIMRIRLPEALRVRYAPEPVSLETPWFFLALSCTQERGQLELAQEFIVRRRFVTIDEYPEFKRTIEQALYLLREQIILEKTE